MTEKKMQWNKAQVKAIESRDGSVLVSAAAGSGKTAVLVERVIERICDEKILVRLTACLSLPSPRPQQPK